MCFIFSITCSFRWCLGLVLVFFLHRTHMLMSLVLVVCVFRTFLHVVIAFMCAMLKIEDQFWIEFTIDLFKMHTFA